MGSILSEIRESHDVQFYSTDQHEDLLYDAVQAHILRAANQDRAKTDAVKSLQCDTILVVMDWAMKFTHMKWFGKRGMNWHISYQNERRKNSLMLLLMCISLTAVPRTPAQFLLYSYNS